MSECLLYYIKDGITRLGHSHEFRDGIQKEQRVVIDVVLSTWFVLLFLGWVAQTPVAVKTQSSVATSSRMSTALLRVPLVQWEKVSDHYPDLQTCRQQLCTSEFNIDRQEEKTDIVLSVSKQRLSQSPVKMLRLMSMERE